MSNVAVTILLLISAAAVALLAVALTRLLRQLGRTAAEVETFVQAVNRDLLPRVERVLDRVEAQMDEAREVTATVRRAAEMAERLGHTLVEIAARSRATIYPVLDTVTLLTQPLKRGAALLAGVKAGLGLLWRPKGGDHSSPRSTKEESDAESEPEGEPESQP